MATNWLDEEAFEKALAERLREVTGRRLIHRWDSPTGRMSLKHPPMQYPKGRNLVGFDFADRIDRLYEVPVTLFEYNARDIEAVGFMHDKLIDKKAAFAALYGADTKEMEEMNTAEQLRQMVEEKRQKAKLEKATELFEAYGNDYFEDGTVIRFVKEWQGHKYTYAGIKAAGNWYITSMRGRNQYTWEDLLIFLVSSDEPTESFEFFPPKDSESNIAFGDHPERSAA